MVGTYPTKICRGKNPIRLPRLRYPSTVNAMPVHNIHGIHEVKPSCVIFSAKRRPRGQGFKIMHAPVRIDDSANEAIVVAMMACGSSSPTWAAIVFARIWKNGCEVCFPLSAGGFQQQGARRRGYVPQLRSSCFHWRLQNRSRRSCTQAAR